MRKLSNIAGYLFIVAVVVLAAIAIMGTWDFLGKDVIYKSFQSFGLLAVVAAIIIAADRTMHPEQTAVVPGTQPSGHAFTIIKRITLSLLIVSVALLALVGMLSIWEVMDQDVVNKSLASIAILGFSSIVITITCKDREGR